MIKMDLMHFGIKQRSGRYPYGSGERPFQGMSSHKRKNLLASIDKKMRSKKIETVRKSPQTPVSSTDIQRNLKEISNRKLTKKNIRLLSDEEVVRNINRLRNEKTLKELIDDDVSPGTKSAIQTTKSIVDPAVRKVGEEVITGTMRYVLKSKMKDQPMTLSGLADMIWPKKDDQKKQQQNNP